ncbi:MAG: hypothetical protein GXO32_08600 [Crenarchaeota archaeon]|nr:hypothetical protein [Thermoproteota archaeon]
MAYELFAQCLRFHGIDVVAFSRRLYRKVKGIKERYLGGSLHALLIEMLRGNAILARVDSSVRCIPISFSYGVTLCIEHARGHALTHYLALSSSELSKTGMQVKPLDLYKCFGFLERVPPYIVLDLSLWELHTEAERGEAYKQVAVLMDTVSRYLTDRHVLLVNPPRVLVKRLHREFGYRPQVIRCVNGECERNIELKTLVLDPYSDVVLSDSAVLEYDAFVIGAVIDDKVPRPYATSLIRRVNWSNAPSARIELWGSRVGVPNRVNKIAEIILKARMTRIDLEDAVLSSMSKSDRLTRLYKEAYSIYSRFNQVPASYIRKLCSMLKLSVEDCLDYLRARGIPIQEE